MKQLTTYNRAAGYLNKLFDLLNQHYFENELTRPTITIQSTPRAYGHFSLRPDTWISANGTSHEINIGAGTLARPIEHICSKKEQLLQARQFRTALNIKIQKECANLEPKAILLIIELYSLLLIYVFFRLK